MKTIANIGRVKMLELIRAMPKPLSKQEQTTVSVKDIKAGGYISLEGDTFFVDCINRYDDGDEWFELVIISLTTGKQIYLEWEDDDSLEVYLYDKNFKLRDLGLTSSNLEAMDEDENEDAEYPISVDGKTLYYEDSGDAKFFKGCADSGETYYYWDFYNEDETICVGIECWDDSKYEACLGHQINPSEIKVLATGA